MLPTFENIRIIEESIEKAKNNHLFELKEIFIFGCTLYATDIIVNLKKYDVVISGFIDNDLSKEGKICSGIRVFRPDYLRKYTSDQLLVIIASHNYWREMKMQLNAIGMLDKDILIINVCDPNQTSLCLTKKDLDKKVLSVQNGIAVYERLNVYSNDGIMIFPYPGTGDIYLACGFLDKYLLKNNIKNPLLVLTKSNGKKVVELFGYESTIIDEYEMKDLICAWQFLGSEKIKIKPLLFWGWDTKYYYRNYKAHKELSFVDYFKYDVFDLEEGDEFVHPSTGKRVEYLEKFFCDNNIVPGKTVIIAPYAGSFVSAISMEVWECVATVLKEKGYSVCTNCYGEELPIAGTNAIQFPYSEVVNVIEHAGGFIAVRSGLCDIASPAKAKMMIIYESNYLASDYQHFSIYKMGLNNEINEIEYEDKDNLIKFVKEIY